MIDIKIKVEGISKLKGRLADDSVKKEIKRWVSYFAHYFKMDMWHRLSNRGNRSTGKLKGSLREDISTNGYTAKVSVGEGIPYALYAEYGIKKPGTIDPGHRMSFPSSSWQKGALTTANMVKINRKHSTHKFAFYKVNMPKRKGIGFYTKSLKDLHKEFENKKGEMTVGLVTRLRKAIFG